MSENVSAAINRTQPLSCASNPTAEKIGKTFAYCLIFLVSLAGNTVIGIVVYKTKTMRKPINFFIVNMAMSDLLFSFLFFPRVIQELYIDSWLIGGFLGLTLCKLVNFSSAVSLTVSIQTLVQIAVDRFGAVVYPLRSPLISSKLCPFLILATWIVAMPVYSPYLVALKLVEHHGRLACRLQWNEFFGESLSFDDYATTMMVVLFFIPFVLIATLYIIIYIKLKSHKIPGEHSVNAEIQRQQRERNVLKMAIAIVLGFVICWLPLSIIGVLPLFTSVTQFSVAVAVAHANCAINPCICFIFSRNYREGLKLSSDK